jgi:hypothetical protein
MPIQATASYTKQIICNKSMACFLSVNLIPSVVSAQVTLWSRLNATERLKNNKMHVLLLN